MDTWTTEQVEVSSDSKYAPTTANMFLQSMQTKGNTVSNNTYNPHRIKLNTPNDMNDFDRTVERFIRQKYERKSLMDPEDAAGSHDIQNDPRYPPSMLDQYQDPMPHLPVQKTGRKFGLDKFRSTSNLLPKRFQKKDTSQAYPAYLNGEANDDNDYYNRPSQRSRADSDYQHNRANKQSRVLGSNLGQGEERFDTKLAQLRDMGFRDSRQNSVVLREAGGDIDRAIEQLVKAADRNKSPIPAPRSPTQSIKVEKRGSAAPATNNPFEMPQRSATAPTSLFMQQHNQQQQQPQQQLQLQQMQHHQHQHQQQQALDQSFQQMSLAQPNMNAHNPYLQLQQTQSHMPPNTYTQSHPVQSHPTGPVFSVGAAQQTQSQQFGSTNPFGTAQSPYQSRPGTGFDATNNFAHQQQQQPFFSQQPALAPQHTSNPYIGQMQQAAPSTNPYGQPAMYQQPQQTGMPQPQYQQPQAQYQPQLQPQQQQPPQYSNRLDKTSILALYAQPQQMQQQVQGQMQGQTQGQMQGQMQGPMQGQMQGQAPMQQQMPPQNYAVNSQGYQQQQQPMQNVGQNPYGR